LLHGDAEAARDFAENPETFTGRFRLYHQAVPPTADGPRAEATSYRAWVRDLAPPGSGVS
jgi:hypothetical protein